MYNNIRTDLASNKTKKSIVKFHSNNIELYEYEKNKKLFHTMYFKNIYDEDKIKDFFKNEILFYFKRY